MIKLLPMLSLWFIKTFHIKKIKFYYDEKNPIIHKKDKYNNIDLKEL